MDAHGDGKSGLLSAIHLPLVRSPTAAIDAITTTTWMDAHGDGKSGLPSAIHLPRVRPQPPPLTTSFLCSISRISEGHGFAVSLLVILDPTGLIWEAMNM